MTNTALLSGRRILVTGASADSAIGLAICQELARLGASLVLLGRRQEPLEKTRAGIAHPEIHSVEVMNLADLDGIAPRVKDIASDGPLHGLVHSASYQGYSPLNRIHAEQFDRYFHVNTAAPLMLAKSLRQKNVCKPGTSIVFIGSVAGLRGQKGRSLYAASKAALVSLTQSLALELADKTIRVNCLAPAVVSGPKADQQAQILAERQRMALLQAHPLGLVRPVDVARACAFLIGPDSAWITGATVPIDGGYLAG